MSRAILLAAGAAVVVWFQASEAFAVQTCSVSGTLTVESHDSYQCDPSTGADCTGWSSTTAQVQKPLRFITVRAEDLSGNLLAQTITDGAGSYTMSFQRNPSCAGFDFRIKIVYRRHRDILGGPRSFVLVRNDNNVVWSTTYSGYEFGTSPCLSTSCSINKNLGENQGSTAERLATMYETADDAIGNMVTWSSQITSYIHSNNTDAAALAIEIDNPGYTGNDFSLASWRIRRAWQASRAGGFTRHELGHAVHAAMLNGGQWMDFPEGGGAQKCLSYKHKDGVNAHNELECEYGFTATFEGIASFLGVASIASPSAENAWFCWCHSEDNDNICAETALTDDGVDGIGDCVGQGILGFSGVGDDFADAPDDCARVHAGTCTCSDADSNNGCDGPGYTPSYQDVGWRSEANVYRFLWDVIDTNDDAGGADDSALTINQVVTAIQNMPCDRTVFNQDGSCNEPNVAAWSTNCNPVSDSAVVTGNAGGTRDAYNAFDIASAIGGNLSGEKAVNCVNGATD